MYVNVIYCFLFITVKNCSIQSLDDLKSASEIGYAALTTIIQFFTSIINETITVWDVKNYREKKQKLKLVCDGANSGIIKFCPEFSQINDSMDASFSKYTKVTEYVSKMKILVKYSTPISKGMYVCNCLISNKFKP